MPSKRRSVNVSRVDQSPPQFDQSRAAIQGAIVLRRYVDPAADISVELVRPDDLLALYVEGYNLRLDASDALHPQLVRKDTTADAHLVVTFPPQSLLERAYFETNSPPLPDTNFRPLPSPPKVPKPDPTPPDELRAPGTIDQARLAGNSRLVFRLPAEVVAIPYRIEGLLDWSRLELAVSPLAAIPATPTAEQLAAAPSISKPGLFETAIEVPYHLMLSPGPNATWIHALAPVSFAGRAELWHTRMALKVDIPLGPRGHGAASQTEMLREIVAIGGAVTAPVRAIWSPDLHAADKEMSDHTDDLKPFRAPMTPLDRRQIVVLTSAFKDYYVGPPKSAQPYVPAPIRVQRLMLSSLGGWLTSRGSWGPDELPYSGVVAQESAPWFLLPFEFARKALSSMWSLVRPGGATQQRLTVTDSPIDAQSITAMKTTQAGERLTETRSPIDVKANAPVSPLTPSSPLTPMKPVMPYTPSYTIQVRDRLDLSEWTHIAAQGRDAYVRIVYEGFLYPFGHRAALIKVTERKFQAAPSGPAQGAPTAYLRQHMYIAVREPEKTYNDNVYSDHTHRQMPLKVVRLTTLVTPNIDPPAAIKDTGYSFWVRVNGAPFKFHAVARDVGSHETDFTAALIFVPFGDVPVDDSKPKVSDPLGKVQAEYQGNAIRRCVAPGRKVAYAEGAKPGAEDTALATDALYFDTQLTGGVPTHFLPVIEKADVTIPALKQLVGANGATTIVIYHGYVTYGAADNDAALSAVNGVFANIFTTAAPVDVKFSADKAGGIATPNLSVSALSRTHGPVGGTLANAVADVFDPSTFFPTDAQLFGAVPLAKVIQTGAIGGHAPKITTSTTAETGGGAKVVTAIDWEPPIKKVPLPGITFTPLPGAALKIHGLITTHVDAAQAVAGGASIGGPPAFNFTGSLTSFSLDLLDVILINFKSFDFSSVSGQKLNVGVQLSDDTPVKFEGPLDFVNALSEVIPKGGFGGDGPHLDVTPQQAQLGYTLGLPPMNIGVFALHDVTIDAGLDLPFTSGKPQVDFSFSKRDHPFIITVECLGGGGFVHVQLTTEKVTVVEGQLEFGGDFSLDVGVASGGVHIMAGIYFKLTDSTSDLTGFVDAGGELSVLGLISVSLDFYLSLSYQKKPSGSVVRGRATLTVAVEVAFFSTSVDVTVERSFGNAPGDPGVSDVLHLADWQAYAKAFG
jgi:hypothetical protein